MPRNPYKGDPIPPYKAKARSMRDPDRELDGTNTEDFPTGEAGRRRELVWDVDKDSRYYVPVREEGVRATGALYPGLAPPRRIANVRRTADALRAFLRFLGLLALAMALIFGLFLAADAIFRSTERPTTTTSEGPG